MAVGYFDYRRDYCSGCSYWHLVLHLQETTAEFVIPLIGYRETLSPDLNFSIPQICPSRPTKTTGTVNSRVVANSRERKVGFAVFSKLTIQIHLTSEEHFTIGTPNRVSEQV